MDEVISECLVDTGAAISVVKRAHLPGKPPEPARLRMKGVLPGTGILYGPRYVTFEMQEKLFPIAAYEAGINEDCILGLNFLLEYHCIIDPVNKRMHLRRPSLLTIQLNQTNNSPSTIFHTRSLYFPVRTSVPVELHPHEARILRLHLHADFELESESEDTGSHRSSRVSVLGSEATTSCTPEEGQEPYTGVHFGLSSPGARTAAVFLGGSSKVVCVMSPPPPSPGVRPEGHGVRVVPEGRPALGERDRGSAHDSGCWVPACSQTAKPGDITQYGRKVASQLSHK